MELSKAKSHHSDSGLQGQLPAKCPKCRGSSGLQVSRKKVLALHLSKSHTKTLNGRPPAKALETVTSAACPEPKH